MASVAFIGTGAMGSRMAQRVVDAGYDLVVWNRSPAKAAQLAQSGAVRADSPAAAAKDADVVITMVADPAALRDVVEGDLGIASTLAARSTLIQMSTVGPAAIARLVSKLPADVDVLDVPVLGSVSEAEAGTLRLFVGGSPRLAERWDGFLRVFGTPLHVGALGAGSAAKLVANSTLFGVLGVLGEAIALAGGLGLSPDATFDVLAATPLQTQAQRRRAALETGDFGARFALALARKDADLVMQAAADAGIDVRLARAAHSWLADAERGGHGARDYSSVLAHITTS